MKIFLAGNYKVNENLRKTLIYLRRWDDYWKLTDPNEKTKIKPDKLQRYPLDFKPRILEGHYKYFDKEGIPVVLDRLNRKYRYTTMCSYALGQSDFYILNGEKEHLDKLIAICDFIIENGVNAGEEILLQEMDKNGEFKGKISAMIQGEAMSVLTRAYVFTGYNKYMDYAIKLIPAFERGIDEKGVVGTIAHNNCKWYEEYPFHPLNHVLNGMIYSLWGLRDLSFVSGSEKASVLYNNGVEYARLSLPLYDAKYWSFYRLADEGENYVASMMYHNLHICQLIALFNQTGIDLFREYAEKFIGYARNPFNRIKAANSISIAKLQKR